MKKSQFTESQIVAILKDGEARGWSVNATLLCCLSGFPLESNGGIFGQGCECGVDPER